MSRCPGGKNRSRDCATRSVVGGINGATDIKAVEVNAEASRCLPEFWRPGAIVPGHLHLSEINFALEDGIIRVTTTSCYFKCAGGEDGVDSKGFVVGDLFCFPGRRSDSLDDVVVCADVSCSLSLSLLQHCLIRWMHRCHWKSRCPGEVRTDPGTVRPAL